MSSLQGFETQLQCRFKVAAPTVELINMAWYYSHGKSAVLFQLLLTAYSKSHMFKGLGIHCLQMNKLRHRWINTELIEPRPGPPQPSPFLLPLFLFPFISCTAICLIPLTLCTVEFTLIVLSVWQTQIINVNECLFITECTNEPY